MCCRLSPEQEDTGPDVWRPTDKASGAKWAPSGLEWRTTGHSGLRSGEGSLNLLQTHNLFFKHGSSVNQQSVALCKEPSVAPFLMNVNGSRHSSEEGQRRIISLEDSRHEQCYVKPNPFGRIHSRSCISYSGLRMPKTPRFIIFFTNTLATLGII